MSNENQYAIVTEDLDLWYGDFQALEKVSLNLRGGIITGLIGPSGCGKDHLPSLPQPCERKVRQCPHGRHH